MGGKSDLEGPNLTQGVAAGEIADGGTLVGHAHGEPVLLARRGEEVFAIVRGAARNWSASSKESLDIIVLVRALQGDEIAQTMLAPGDPAAARRIARTRLRRKIASYRSFNERYPGFGGFLPWFQVEGATGERHMVPTWDWQDRVPGLDNGQLVWSIYVAANALRDVGEHELARLYGEHFDLMRGNVVRIFYDPRARHLRAETKLVDGAQHAPAHGRYRNNVKGYFLNDAYEGLMMVHFADLFGDWSEHPDGREHLWRSARRVPRAFTTQAGKQIDVVEGHWASGHETWGEMVLPYGDVEIARALSTNLERVRTIDAAERGRPAFAASAARPVRGNESAGYLTAVGIRSIAKQPIESEQMLSPYAGAGLALVDKPLFAAWLRNSLGAPHVMTRNGWGESFDVSGEAAAPVMTWDGNVLPMVSYMGGIRDDVRTQLQRDGKYDQFIARTQRDYRRFDGKTVRGSDIPMRAPTVGSPRAGARSAG